MVTSFGGMLATATPKELFARPRPERRAALARGDLEQLSSGHAMQSAIVYLTLGATPTADCRRAADGAYVLCIAALLSLLVGTSRVFLGASTIRRCHRWLDRRLIGAGCRLIAQWFEARAASSATANQNPHSLPQHGSPSSWGTEPRPTYAVKSGWACAVEFPRRLGRLPRVLDSRRIDLAIPPARREAATATTDRHGTAIRPRCRGWWRRSSSSVPSMRTVLDEWSAAGRVAGVGVVVAEIIDFPGLDWEQPRAKWVYVSWHAVTRAGLLVLVHRNAICWPL